MLNYISPFSLSFYQCWGSVTVTFWRGSGSADPYLCLMDPDLTPFFSDFKKKFLNLPTGTLSSVINLLLKINFMLRFILQALFQSAQHLYEKREGSRSGADPDPYLQLTDPDPAAQKHADPDLQH
jgi:hypothetical protein